MKKENQIYKHKLPFRQIHLDFHTSELIENVGEHFDKEEFVQTLLKAHINSISCFARCHHGWLYYDSKRFPDKIHPQLKNKNLLKEQIEVCHQHGIKVPIYISAMWDYICSQEHPEWLCIGEDGNVLPPKASNIGFYTNFCLNSPYKEYLKELTQDVFDTFGEEIDGLFYDIVWDTDCYCDACKQKMLEKGYDIDNKDDVEKYKYEKVNDFIEEMSGFIRERDNGISIYYNNGCVRQGHRDSLNGFSHLEFDALPSGHSDGYDTLLLRSRFDRTLGLDYVGQTGKFHTAWADFHTFKNKEALEYECFKLLSYGAKCLIGDQLLPSGKLCKYTYDLIGSVYGEVEKKEPWCENVEPIVEIGLFTPEEFGHSRDLAISAAKILEEAGLQFDLIDSYSDFSRYKLIVLVDKVIVNESLNLKLSKYIKDGGKLIATFESGLNPEQTDFSLKELGIKLNQNQLKDEEGNLVRGKFYWRNHYGDYILPKGQIGEGLHETEYMMYSKAIEVSAVKEENVLNRIIEPYFYRTQEHFCAHRQAPSSGKESTVAITMNKNIIYFAHPMFGIYREYAPSWVKQMILNAVGMLLDEPILRHDGPPTLQTTVNSQSGSNRWIVHLLHYIPQQKAKKIQVVDAKIPLYNVKLSLKTTKQVKSVKYVPENIMLDFECIEGRINFTVPKIYGHEMIEIAYK